MNIPPLGPTALSAFAHPIMRWLTTNDMIQPCALKCWWRLIRLTRRSTGYRDASVSPAPASFDDGLGEFTLPYTAVREADDPDTGRWDRAVLERSL